MRIERLPSLPFGDRNAVMETDVRQFADRMSKVVTSLQTYDVLKPGQAFASKSKIIQINGLKIAASANTSVQVDVGDTGDMTLMVPFSGSNQSTFEHRTLDWSAGDMACYLPAIGRAGSSSTRSTLTLTFDPERLQSTAGAMLGCAPLSAEQLRLGTPRVIALRARRLNFMAMFRRLCGLIDEVNADVRLLGLQGVDDVFYRHLAMLMSPERLLWDEARHGAERGGLEMACQYVLAHLHQCIALSDLERLSGMSARALQYAFQSRFQCTPMQWVKQQRMARARKQLRQARESDTVIQIALACGFASPSLFARDYKKQYGELPSLTLRQSLAQ